MNANKDKMLRQGAVLERLELSLDAPLRLRTLPAIQPIPVQFWAGVLINKPLMNIMLNR
jgi:hypothetical protein